MYSLFTPYGQFFNVTKDIPREGQQLKKCQTWECPKLPVFWEIHQIPNFLKIIIAVRPSKLLYLKILLPRQETV